MAEYLRILTNSNVPSIFLEEENLKTRSNRRLTGLMLRFERDLTKEYVLWVWWSNRLHRFQRGRFQVFLNLISASQPPITQKNWFDGSEQVGSREVSSSLSFCVYSVVAVEGREIPPVKTFWVFCTAMLKTAKVPGVMFINCYDSMFNVKPNNVSTTLPR